MRVVFDGISGPCYKFEMLTIVEQWLLFKYIDRELTPLSKPFKSRELAGKAREKYSQKERKMIAVGLVRKVGKELRSHDSEG